MSLQQDFVPFATGGSANVIDQATYNGLAARTNGFATGIADSAQLNKVWRQSSFVIAALMQFVQNVLDIDIVDDGNLTNAITNITNAIADTAIAQMGVTFPTNSNQAITLASNQRVYVNTVATTTYTVAQSNTLTTQWRVSVFAQAGPIIVAINGADTLNGGAAGVGYTIPKGFWGLLCTDAAGKVYLACDAIGLFDRMYPLGTTYMQVNGAGNPNALFPGTTWAATLVGRTPVGLDAGQTEFTPIGHQGGEKTHILTITEMPSHNHSYQLAGTPLAQSGSSTNCLTSTTTANTGNTGGGAAHNNLQPYEVVVFWKRTA